MTRKKIAFLFLGCYRTCKFSQFLNFESSLPKIHVNIWRAFILARTIPRFLYQCVLVSLSPCSRFNRIWLRIPTRSSSTLWLIPTDISINFARYVQARHFPSEIQKKKKTNTQIILHSYLFLYYKYAITI